MDTARLRSLLRNEVVGLSRSLTHKTIPSACEQLGLTVPPEAGSKADRVAAAFDAVTDRDLGKVASNLLSTHPLTASDRNAIQDLLWMDVATPEIPKRFRHDVARALSVEDLYLNAREFDKLLDCLWDLGNDALAMIFGGTQNSLRSQIDRHVHRNPGDWSVEHLFDQLGAFQASDRRFIFFLEGLTSPDVRPNEREQRRFAEVVNGVLRKCGVELRETGTEGGYPVFSLLSLRAGPIGRPKNLIFASSVKPDIRFRDAVNNDVEIVSNADKVLVYDREIGMDGVRWADLQAWWSETNAITDPDEAKTSLYRRLRSSLPRNSPPQACLFNSFYKGFGQAIPLLPASLPEVWLHWDPKTAKERGRDALLRFRMDFLLLLPQRVRVVVEVDGKQHYSRDDGAADPGTYAAMVAADRELKLSGYEVFRFGAVELHGAAQVASQLDSSRTFSSDTVWRSRPRQGRTDVGIPRTMTECP